MRQKVLVLSHVLGSAGRGGVISRAPGGTADTEHQAEPMLQVVVATKDRRSPHLTHTLPRLTIPHLTNGKKKKRGKPT